MAPTTSPHGRRGWFRSSRWGRSHHSRLVGIIDRLSQARYSAASYATRAALMTTLPSSAIHSRIRNPNLSLLPSLRPRVPEKLEKSAGNASLDWPLQPRLSEWTSIPRRQHGSLRIHVLRVDSTPTLASLILNGCFFMSINQYLTLGSRRRLFLVIAFSTLTVAAVAFAGTVLFHPEKNPGPPHDVRFVVLGEAYLPQLGRAYAAAWEEGAKQLDAGKRVSEALETVAKAWSTNRTTLYDQLVTPEFAMIVAEGADDTRLSPRERAALAAAWRGLSRGLAR